MEIQEIQTDDIRVYGLSGRLDSNTSPELEKRLADAISSGVRRMVLDFENLEYISSAGLRIVLKTTKDLGRSNGRLALCAMQDYVKEVFEIAGFDTFLEILPTREEALARV